MKRILEIISLYITLVMTSIVMFAIVMLLISLLSSCNEEYFGTSEYTTTTITHTYVKCK